MRRRGRDRCRPAQARLDAMWLRMGILGEEDFSRRSRIRKRHDSAQRPLGHGAPVKSADEIRDDLIRIRGGVALPTTAIFRPIFMEGV